MGLELGFFVDLFTSLLTLVWPGLVQGLIRELKAAIVQRLSPTLCLVLGLWNNFLIDFW